MTQIFSSALEGYIDCAIWTATDGDEPLDRSDHEGFTDKSMVDAIAELADFIRSNWDDCYEYAQQRGWSNLGHDFSLTRNHHGAGFWDRGLDELGDRLTAAAQSYGEINVFRLDDGHLVFE